MVREDATPLASEIPAPGLLSANTVGAIGVSALTTFALAKGYNGPSGTLWMLTLAATMGLTAFYATRGRGKTLFALALGANALWCSGCLWGLYVLPPFGVILVIPGLCTAANMICLLSVLPRVAARENVKNA